MDGLSFWWLVAGFFRFGWCAGARRGQACAGRLGSAGMLTAAARRQGGLDGGTPPSEPSRSWAAS